MPGLEQKKKAKEFAEFCKGYKKRQSQIFWTKLLMNVFGVENICEFEDQVHIDKTTGFIDGNIPSTKVLIKQKSIEKDLNKLCVRLVFCLYAEDASLFGRKKFFHDYLSKYENSGLMRKNLIELFKV